MGETENGHRANQIEDEGEGQVIEAAPSRETPVHRLWLKNENEGMAMSAVPVYSEGEAMISEPHESHDMTPWRSTIVTIIATPRFGEFRKCRLCDAEQAKTVAGSAEWDEITLPCEFSKRDDND